MMIAKIASQRVVEDTFLIIELRKKLRPGRILVLINAEFYREMYLFVFRGTGNPDEGLDIDHVTGPEVAEIYIDR